MNEITKIPDGMAAILNEIESAGGCVTPEQESQLAGYSVAELLRAALALKAVSDDLEAELLPAKARIQKAKEEINRFDRAYDRLREAMRQKAIFEGWMESGATDPDDLASVSFQENKPRVELLGSIDDVPVVYVRYVKQVDEEAALPVLLAGGEVPGLRLVRERHTRINLRKKGKALMAALGIRSMLNGAGPPKALEMESAK